MPTLRHEAWLASSWTTGSIFGYVKGSKVIGKFMVKSLCPIEPGHPSLTGRGQSKGARRARRLLFRSPFGCAGRSR